LPDRLLDILAGTTTDDQAARSGIITVVNTNGTVSLNYLGGVFTNVPVLSTYTPTTGDVVQVMRRGPGSLMVIGAVRTSNPSGGTVVSDFVITYNVDAVPSAITGGGTAGSSGVLTVRPYIAGSYRRVDGWSRADVRQGVYYTSTHLGYYHGGWFYGTNAFGQLKGRTVTRVRLYLKREQAGTFNAEPIYLYGHKNAQKPTGDIYYVGQKIGNISIAYPGSGVYDLPLPIGTQLGSGYLKGLGLLYSGTGDYVVLSSLASYADSGRLDISWRED
jgi:hypothetical protein